MRLTTSHHLLLAFLIACLRLLVCLLACFASVFALAPVGFTSFLAHLLAGVLIVADSKSRAHLYNWRGQHVRLHCRKTPYIRHDHALSNITCVVCSPRQLVFQARVFLQPGTPLLPAYSALRRSRAASRSQHKRLPGPLMSSPFSVALCLCNLFSLPKGSIPTRSPPSQDMRKPSCYSMKLCILRTASDCKQGRAKT